MKEEPVFLLPIASKNVTSWRRRQEDSHHPDYDEAPPKYTNQGKYCGISLSAWMRGVLVGTVRNGIWLEKRQVHQRL